MKWPRITTVAISVLLCLQIFAIPAWAYSQKDEERIGREAASEIDEECKLVDDPAIVERVQKIGNTLAKIANETEIAARYGSSDVYQFDYQFKVIENEEVNAFSLPGGTIYVNTGLLDLCESDDELAGVLAHEIAHASHHHMMHIMRKQSKVDKYIALVALAGILSNMRGKDLNNLLFGAQMIRAGKTSSYTQEAEKDADRTAVAYIARSPYSAEGLLSFMKKLDKKRDENPTVTLGIFQTHPASYRRAIAITKAMQEEGLNIDIRKLRDVAYAKVVPMEDNSNQCQVVIGEKVIYCPADLSSGESSKQRSEAIAASINNALDSGITARQLDVDVENCCIKANNTPIIKITPEDTKLHKCDEKTLLKNAQAGLAYATWADWICNGCELLQELAKDDSY